MNPFLLSSVLRSTPARNMNSSNVCLLLCCIALIGTAPSASERTTTSDALYTNVTSANNGPSPYNSYNTTHLTIVKSTGSTNVSSSSDTTPMSDTLHTSETSGSSSTLNINTTSRANTGLSTRPPPTEQPTPCPSVNLFYKKYGTILLMLTGGLLLLCTLLLVTCVVLSCQVCHLKRQPHSSYRPTRSNVDLLSGMSFLGTAQRNKEAAAKAEVAEDEPTKTSMLMKELRQSQEREIGNGAQEGGMEDKKDETAKETSKEEEKKGEAKANSFQGKAESAENGTAGSAKTQSCTKEESSASTKAPAEPTDPPAMAAPSSEAPSDVVVVVV